MASDEHTRFIRDRITGEHLAICGETDREAVLRRVLYDMTVAGVMEPVARARYDIPIEMPIAEAIDRGLAPASLKAEMAEAFDPPARQVWQSILDTAIDAGEFDALFALRDADVGTEPSDDAEMVRKARKGIIDFALQNAPDVDRDDTA